MILIIYFRHIVSIELFDLDPNSSNLIESLSIIEFLVDSLVDFSVNFLFYSAIKICIIPISLKTLNLSLGWLILMNLQSSSFSTANCLS